MEAQKQNSKTGKQTPKKRRLFRVKKQTPQKKASAAATAKKQPQQSASKPQTPQPQKARTANTNTRKPTPKKRTLSARERNGLMKLAAILTVALLFYVVLMLIIALFVWYSFSTPAQSSTLYAVKYFHENEEKAFLSDSVEHANNSYGLYLRYSDLYAACGFGVAGDTEQVTIFLPEKSSSNSIVCYRDSSLVQINGTSVRLSAPILFEEEDYLLPVSLFEGYVHGLDIQYDESDRVCRITIPDTPVFSLKLQKPETMPTIDPAQLPSITPPSDSSEPTKTP